MTDRVGEGQAGYAEYYGIETAAGRLGLMVCLRCGATVLIGTTPEDAPKLHDQWHAKVSYLYDRA